MFGAGGVFGSLTVDMAVFGYFLIPMHAGKNYLGFGAGTEVAAFGEFVGVAGGHFFSSCLIIKAFSLQAHL